MEHAMRKKSFLIAGAGLLGLSMISGCATPSSSGNLSGMFCPEKRQARFLKTASKSGGDREIRTSYQEDSPS